MVPLYFNMQIQFSLNQGIYIPQDQQTLILESIPINQQAK